MDLQDNTSKYKDWIRTLNVITLIKLVYRTNNVLKQKTLIIFRCSETEDTEQTKKQF